MSFPNVVNWLLIYKLPFWNKLPVKLIFWAVIPVTFIVLEDTFVNNAFDIVDVVAIREEVDKLVKLDTPPTYKSE